MTAKTPSLFPDPLPDAPASGAAPPCPCAPAGGDARLGEHWFRSLVENSPDVIFRFDAQRRLIYVSPNIKEYSVATEQDSLGKTIDELPYNAEFSAFLQRNISRAVDLRLAVQANLHFVSSKGLDITAEARVWPEFDRSGEIISIVASVRDISFMQRIEQSYRALFSSMADGFALFELLPVTPRREEDFVLLLMNLGFARMHSLSSSHGQGRTLSELMGASAPDWRRLFLHVRDSGESAVARVHDFASGRHFEISAYAPEEGRIACIVKDITEAQASSERIRLNDARLTALYAISQLNDETPEDEVALFALDKAVQLTGSRAGALLLAPGQGLDMPRHFWIGAATMNPEEENRRRTLSRRVLEGVYTGQYPPGIYNDLSLFPPQMAFEGHPQRCLLVSLAEKEKIVCIAAVSDKGVPYGEDDLRQTELFIGGMWQILRRRWTLISLTRAKEEAELANSVKNEFLANVSHELRTPLNGVLGMLQLLQMSGLTREQREWVETADFSSKSLLRIISDILDFSRVEAGKMELRRQPFSLEATLRAAVDTFAHDARRKKLDLTLYTDLSVPPMLMGDDARVRQIIFNLLGNAVKFTEQGRVHVRGSMLPRAGAGKAVAYITVEDTGIGIPEDKLEHIFQAFTQLDGSHTRVYSGTGLGLAIVHRLLVLLGGSLCVESEPGRGTRMHLSLPFEPAPAQAALKAEDAAMPLSPSRALRILVAEDDLVNQITIRGMLTRLGHEVACVENGHMALQALNEDDFDCLLTDIQMPVMSGTELLWRINADKTSRAMHKNRAIPVIALTAHAMAGDRERFLTAGFDEYIAKPIAVADLQNVLSWLTQKLTTAGTVRDKEGP